MSADNLAAALGVSFLTVYNWERKGLPNSMAASRMERLESTLQVPKGWLLSTEMLADDPPTDQPAARADRMKAAQDTTIDAATVAEAIGCVATGIALARYKYPRVDAGDVDLRNAEMFAARYGVSGPDGALLEAIGQANGITRERVRQITEAMAQESARFTFRLPILDTVRAELDALLPMPEEQLNERLQAVLGHALTIDDANRFCVEILGIKLVAFLDLGSGPNANQFERVVVTPGSEAECQRWVKDVHSLALDMIRAAGAAHLPTVIGQGVIAGLPIEHANVAGVLKVNKGFAWLSQADGWFWFGEGVPARNPLLSTAREIVTAAGGRADVEDIRAGLMNTQAAWGRRDDARLGLAVVPPAPIVRTLLGQVPWLETVQSNDFRLSGQAASFSEAEAIVLGEVKRLGGVASRSMLKDALVETGHLPLVTLNFILDTSAIFTRVTRGVFGVRGLDYPIPALLLAMETVLGRKPILTNRGNTNLSFRLS